MHAQQCVRPLLHELTERLARQRAVAFLLRFLQDECFSVLCSAALSGVV